jgi:hypothetical protein
MTDACVQIIATVSAKVWLDDEETIIEYGGIKEAAQAMLSYEINAIPEAKAGIESWDHVDVIDYGDFGEPMVCSICGTDYANRADVEHIGRYGHCTHCVDPEEERRKQVLQMMKLISNWGTRQGLIPSAFNELELANQIYDEVLAKTET